MGYVKNDKSKIGMRVILTEKKSSMAGHFDVESEVTITNVGERGYEFTDEHGNKVTEAGWGGFREKSD